MQNTKSRLKRQISGHQSLQRGLREPLLRVRTDLWQHWDQAITLSALANMIFKSLSKSTSLGVFWCTRLLFLEFKITKPTVIFFQGRGLGSHAVWRVHRQGKKVPWRFQRAMQLCLWARAPNVVSSMNSFVNPAVNGQGRGIDSKRSVEPHEHSPGT